MGAFLMKAAAFREKSGISGLPGEKKIALETCYNFMQTDTPLKQNS